MFIEHKIYFGVSYICFHVFEFSTNFNIKINFHKKKYLFIVIKYTV